MDAIILNIKQACQAAIDLAHHLVAIRRPGMPQTSAEVFILLSQNNLIKERTAKSMIAMTGFRNIAIH